MPSTELKEWKSTGEIIDYGPLGHAIFVKQLGNAYATPNNTLLIIHGFPESSYSFHAVVEGLLNQFERIILFDMIGYGWSDKPVTNYSYSLMDQADSALAVWNHFGVTGGHVLAHDMGDSVASELVARHVQALLPGWFKDGFQSFTFTNGSMVLDLAKLRVMQKVLLSKYGKSLQSLTRFNIFKQQVKSAHGNDNLSDLDIKNLWLGNTINDGHLKTYLTIHYLNDRKKFEQTRWLPAFTKLELPIHLCWGADDQVAKVEMAHYLKKNKCPSAKLTIMKQLGHFCQLGNPDRWLEHVLSFYA